MTLAGPQIDPTAKVDPAAVIGSDVLIGPYCVVGPHVSIGEGCKLESHVHVSGHTSIGANTVVSPFAVLGGPPQSTGYRGGATRLVIGANCIIRESVTMNRGSEDGNGVTQVGDNGFFMAYSHVGHDCKVGHHAIFANCATLGGHCVIGDHVFMGGLSAAHQFTWIGSHAMVGGASAARGDIIPFAIANGSVARLSGINTVGMRRREFAKETVRAVRNVYRTLFHGDGLFQERVQLAEAAHGADPGVAAILEFIRAPRKRPLCYPRGNAAED
jgi:UDP-N-acetylglucosamine acyltransferase